VAEELALDELLAEGGAVDGDELTLPAAAPMKLVRDLLLACAGLADDQHRRDVGCRTRELRAQAADRQRFAGDRGARDLGRVLVLERVARFIDHQDVAQAEQGARRERMPAALRALAVDRRAVSAAEVAAHVRTERRIPFDREVRARDGRMVDRRHLRIVGLASQNDPLAAEIDDRREVGRMRTLQPPLEPRRLRARAARLMAGRVDGLLDGIRQGVPDHGGSTPPRPRCGRQLGV
jgi:hypothetical protein